MQTDARTSMKPMKLNGGFTLVELIMVMVITGILGASMLIFFKPAVDSYFDSRRRAGLTDMADTALRKMGRDIRSAVPNSIRSVSSTCFQLVPTITGGRYRMAPDTVNDNGPSCTPSATCSAPLDTSQATTVFDVLTPLTRVPAENDWVVINNQDGDDVYNGTNRSQINAAVTAPSRTTDGTYRIQIDSKQFSSGYDGGRFVAVANNEQTVFYSCVGNVLYRTVASFGASQATTCAATSGAKLAENVSACTFVYSPNQGATQESGFVWMQLEMTDAGETIALNYGAHVDNVP